MQFSDGIPSTIEKDAIEDWPQMKEFGPNFTYRIIKCIIEEIDKSDGHIPFPELLEQIKMSNADLKRHLAKFAAISPKIWCQYLTLEYAKQLLKNHQFVWNTSCKLGVSGLGIHADTVVTWDSVNTQGSAKKKKRLVIGYSWMESLFGEALIMATKRGICGIAFSSEVGKIKVLSDMMRRWPQAVFKKDNGHPLKADFQVSQVTSDIKIHVIGTQFQVQVWKALTQIPSGHVTTYSDIAGAIGKPAATRAVGTAIGKNPISWLIPCHRAIRKSGELGGYNWGLPLKRTMLAYESARRVANL